MIKWKNIIKNIANALYPDDIKCILCGLELRDTSVHSVCDKCYDRLPRIAHNKCVRCGAALPEGYSTLCSNCKRHNFSYISARAAFEYTGNIRSAIYRYKYERERSLAEPMSMYMAEVLATTDWHIDMVQAIPLHPNRLRSRGYNQAELLAIGVCGLLGLTLVHHMSRVKDTPSQTTLSHTERVNNLTDAFAIDASADIVGKTILIIDDVYTTGATIEHASAAYMSAGASAVYALTLAHAVEREIEDQLHNE